jgi:predicted patatin/cPLA2 family phospholipase
MLELKECMEKNYNLKENIFLNSKKQYVFSGGGIACYYNTGIGHILQKYTDYKNIDGLIGVSGGAITAVYIACKIDMIKALESIEIIKSKLIEGNTLLDAIYLANTIVLPENAHILCNELNVEIVAAEISYFGIKKKIFKNFTSRDQLFQCISASICIPYLVNWKYPYYFCFENKYYIDGGIVDNIPIKYDCLYDQIIINSFKINYPLDYRFSPIDPNIHVLMIKGLNHFLEFIDDNSNNSININTNPCYKNIIQICYKHNNNLIYKIYFIFQNWLSMVCCVLDFLFLFIKNNILKPKPKPKTIL